MISFHFGCSKQVCTPFSGNRVKGIAEIGINLYPPEAATVPQKRFSEAQKKYNQQHLYGLLHIAEDSSNHLQYSLEGLYAVRQIIYS